MSPGSAVRTMMLAGVAWTVREVHRPDSHHLLVFDSRGEQRWLTPVPPDWRSWDELRLQDACLRAATAQLAGVRFPG